MDTKDCDRSFPLAGAGDCADEVKDLHSAEVAPDIGSKGPFLNMDCLMAIFAYLDLKEWMVVEQVCKNWQIAVRKLWLSKSELRLDTIFRTFQGPYFTPERFLYVAKKCSTQLTSLKMIWGEITLSCAKAVGKNFQNLQTLDLGSSSISSKCLTVLAKYCPDLRRVSLHRYHIGEKGLRRLIKRCGLLKELDLPMVGNVTGSCFQHAGSSLTSVNLTQNYDMSSKGVRLLATNCPNLKELKLGHASYVEWNALNLMLEKLTGLEVLWMHQVNQECVRHLKSIQRLTCLRELNLKDSPGLDDQFLRCISSKCTRLEVLDISAPPFDVNAWIPIWGPESLTDAGMSYLGKLPFLHDLTINFCQDVTGTGLIEVAHNQKLTRLVARGCVKLTEEPMELILNCCPGIVLMVLTSCPFITTNLVEKAKQVSLLRGPEEKPVIVCVEALEDDEDYEYVEEEEEVEDVCGYNGGRLMDDWDELHLEDYCSDEDDFGESNLDDFDGPDHEAYWD